MEEAVPIALAPELRRRAQRRAAELGLTLSDYIAGMVALDLESWAPDDDALAAIPVRADEGHGEHTAASTADDAGSDDEAATGDSAEDPEVGVMNIGEAVAARMRKAAEGPG